MNQINDSFYTAIYVFITVMSHTRHGTKTGQMGFVLKMSVLLRSRLAEQFKEIGVRLTEPVLPFTDSFGCDIAKQFCNQFVLETKR